jgi:hypothetical protein
MPVIYGKKGTPRPLLNFLEFGLYDIEYDANPVFIVVAHHSLMCVCCVSDDNPVFFGGELCRVVLLFELLDLLAFELYVLTALVECHLHTTVVYDLAIAINRRFDCCAFLFIVRDVWRICVEYCDLRPLASNYVNGRIRVARWL